MRPATGAVEHAHAQTARDGPALSPFEQLPQDVVNQILSYLTHPRSRLPGLTETQSELPVEAIRAIKNEEDLTTPADTDRWAADVFALPAECHPFLTLSVTSKKCHDFVEQYCGHLVRVYNGCMFRLPFHLLDDQGYGPTCVYPDMTGIVYRRLWLQYAPRRCMYCSVVMDIYPFHRVKRLLVCCDGCFLRQALVSFIPFFT